MNHLGLPPLGPVHPRSGRGFLRILQVQRRPLYPGVAPDAHFTQANSVGDHHRRPPDLPHLRQADLWRAGDPPIRHRRETSLEVTRLRLLSLDFVLDHPELAWLPTEEEKLACFEQLGIEPWMLPRRIYAGQAKGRVQYFPLRMPVAMGPEATVFVYIDPGMGTRTELHSWGAAHCALWEKLRESGRRIKLVAVAWEQHLLDRAERVFQSWRGRAITDAEKEILTLQLAVDNGDWETLEPYGGLDAAMRKLHQLEQQSPNINGFGMMDEFRLWGSRWCRRMHAPLTKVGWLI